MLEVKDITKSFHNNKVVDGVSFSVESGQILGIIGHNGAGKSTCISMISTILKPDSGAILFDGEDIVKNPAAIRSKMGLVPQDIALYETLTGLDNLRFWGKTYGVKKADLAARIRSVCEIIGFDSDMLAKRVSEYSGGMKRRLNIGVALLHRPSLVILDEPTTGIDIQSADQILNSIENLRRQGTAVIYVGHYMEEVERISTHVCILENGKCRRFGAIDELLETPEGRISLAALYNGVSDFYGK